MSLNPRKLVKFVDKTFIEGGKKAKEPVIMVSVALDTMRQLEAQLMMRNYEGFLN